MKRNLKHLLFGIAVTVFGTSYGQSEIINISTGIAGTGVNGANIAYAQFDDNWTVAGPNGIFIAPRVAWFQAWDESGCSRWISADAHAGNGQAESVDAGTYTYRGTFAIQSTQIGCAVLRINTIGADNNVLGLQVNGHSYSLTLPGGNNHFDPLVFPNAAITINPAHLNPGTNNIITITTDNEMVFSGLTLCGRLEIVNQDIDPVITGPSTVCQGSPLTFTGSVAPGSGTPTDHLWRLLECDAAGNLVSGGFSWEQWFDGPPTTYTYPSNLSLTCGKYYMVVLAAVYESPCSNWAQELKVIYYACKPTANAGADKIVAEDQCVSIGGSVAMKLTTYNWTASGSSVGTGVTISVCPEVNTTYTLTATNQYGCTATDQVVVTVLPNNPAFNMATNTSNNNYYTATATPVVTNANTVPGFGAYWSVEELDANGNILYRFQNPEAWWPYPDPCSFKGFYDDTQNYDVVPNSIDIYTSVPTNPPPTIGRFVYNKTYRITRGTWNNNCTWNAVAFIMTSVRSSNGGAPQVVIYETEAPEFDEVAFASMKEEAANQWVISPNPSNGVFNISSEDMKQAVVEVIDLLGNKIQTHVIAAGTTSFPIDLNGFAKGIYVLNITSGDVTSTHKVILE